MKNKTPLIAATLLALALALSPLGLAAFRLAAQALDKKPEAPLATPTPFADRLGDAVAAKAAEEIAKNKRSQNAEKIADAILESLAPRGVHIVSANFDKGEPMRIAIPPLHEMTKGGVDLDSVREILAERILQALELGATSFDLHKLDDAAPR